MIYLSYSKKKKNLTKTIMVEGNGIFTINNLNINYYFKNLNNKIQILFPILISNIKNKNFYVYTYGGGKGSQIKTIKISICKTILLNNFNLKFLFRRLNFISVDDRKIERKIYGRKKSRKKEQYSKR